MSENDPNSRPIVDCEVLPFFRAIANYLETPEQRVFASHPDLASNAPKKLSWATVCDLYDGLDDVCPPDLPIERLGYYVNPSLPRAAGYMLGLVTTPKMLYKVAYGWFGTKILPHLVLRIEDLAPHQIRITVRIPDDMRDCPNFFRANVGAMEAVPNLVDLPNAIVRSEVTDRCHIATIDLPPHHTLWARLTRIPKVLFAPHLLMHEIAAQQQELGRQFAALKVSHAEEEAARALAEAAQRRAETALLVKSEFLSVMSHELRTPLNGIVCSAETLLDELDGEQLEMLQIVRKCSDDLLEMVSQILEFAELEEGDLVVVNEPMELSALIGRALAPFEKRAEAKGLEFNVYLDESVPQWALGDPRRIAQILRALVDNSIKFTQKGVVRVEASAVSDDGETIDLALVVSDTGIGIGPEALGKVFAVFAQADSSSTRAYGGTGVGLAMARGLAHALCGDITVESELNQGTKFRFTLPARRCDPSSRSDVGRAISFAAQEQHTSGESQSNRIVPRILLVDDNIVVHKAFARLLAAYDVELVAVTNGAEAVGTAQRQHFDAIFMDCEMPGMDGFEATRQIRELEETPRRRPIIATTAYVTAADRQRCVDAGMDEFLSKPVDRQALAATLERFAPLANEPGGSDAPRHVLVVEDNATNRRVLGVLLRRLGCRVDEVENGELAVDAVQRVAYDAVFMDCEMPVLDGCSATREIRALEAEPWRTPIIAITAYSSTRDRTRCETAGMDDFMAKPATAEKLRQHLGRWVPDAAPVSRRAA